MEGQLYTVSAPSGAGKTSLVRQLMQRIPELKVSVSHTTRPMRPGDLEGRDYFFVDKPRFEQMIEEKAFLEYAQVFDNYYGTSRAAVEATLKAGHDVLLEIDWQGASQVKQMLPDTCSIFILPPSREALVERLKGRGQDSEDVIARRTADAVSEMVHYHAADYLIINDQFDVAVHQLVSLVQAGMLTLPRQQERYGDLIAKLIDN